METFSALLALCAGNSPVTGELPSHRPVTWSFDVFFDLRLYKRLSKQSWGWWFETPSRLLWRHCNAVGSYYTQEQCAFFQDYGPVNRLLNGSWYAYRHHYYISPDKRRITLASSSTKNTHVTYGNLYLFMILTVKYNWNNNRFRVTNF